MGAAVLLKNMRTGLENTVKAGDDASYRFNRLTTSDRYELLVTLPHFGFFNIKGVNIGWKVATRLDIVLKPK